MARDAAGRVTCPYCGLRPVDRGRRLCFRCRKDSDARALYPPRGDVRGSGAARDGGRADPEPTTARPGTPEKVAVLAMRHHLKQRLWHPLDAGAEGASAGLLRSGAHTEG